jgi:mono/diheme cytochrome c family protein
MVPRCYDPGVIRRALLLVVAVLVCLALGIALAPAALRARADNPIWRGQRLAARHGCLNCHRAPLRQDLANPGSPFDVVPGFDSGDLALYAESKAEVEEWIRDGSTARLRADRATGGGGRTQLLRMPAFGGRLRDDEISDLAAFVIASNALHSPAAEPARLGEDVARRHCLSCHNVGGAGGLANPGSAFGYVPGLWGPDAGDLARDRAEIAEWVRTGTSRRVDAWPLARRLRAGQAVEMPAFGEVLSEEEQEAVVAYVEWLARTRGGVTP